MTLIDTLEYYYGNRDENDQIRKKEEPQGTEIEFDKLEDYKGDKGDKADGSQ